MLAVRTALFLLFQAVTVVPWGLCCLLIAPLPLHLRYQFTIGWTKMVLWAARVICGIGWEVRGRENFPDGPAIILSKHQSTWETFFYVSWLPREVCFVFKRELLWIPFFGWGIGLLKMIHIDRRQGRDAFESVVRQGQRKLDEGRWIVMFPEGTRTRVGSQGKYKSGGARLAVRTGAPVVPIAVNAGECWPKKPIIKRPGRVVVSVGPPIPTAGREPDEVNDEAERWIEAEMRRISPHAYRSPSSPPALHEATS
ncbi:MAG: 1-acyl-sn-glycerol-3-phosphate acyltransferase [Burkholderiales bacterium]|nr:MAG: 1-acyl-sn-glycerol-3-phosphate acyltransferase [Burkholderiales bacterium]